MEWSIYKVGIPPSHNLDKPHGLVTSTKNTLTNLVKWRYPIPMEITPQLLTRIDNHKYRSSLSWMQPWVKGNQKIGTIEKPTIITDH